MSLPTGPAPTAHVWAQSLNGRVLDLLAPDPATVDFREIAYALAGLNRYAGNALWPVSVAFHTLIAFEAAEPDIKPYVLLHDAHETRLGDITTPAAQALDAVAAAILGTNDGDIRDALNFLKRNHDLAIWAAAGLPEPKTPQKARIARCDIVALNTERRDFLSASPKKWAAVVESVPPATKVYRPTSFGRTAHDVAERLLAEFRTHLPVFATGVPLPHEGTSA